MTELERFELAEKLLKTNWVDTNSGWKEEVEFLVKFAQRLREENASLKALVGRLTAALERVKLWGKVGYKNPKDYLDLASKTLARLKSVRKKEKE